MKAKKIIAIILTMVMVLSVVPVSAFAASVKADYTIKAGETLTVSFEDSNNEDEIIVRFAPEQDCYLSFSSESDDANSDPYCNMYDSTLSDSIIWSDDGYVNDEIDYDFYFEYEFTGGEVYYFAMGNYDDATSWQVTLECFHSSYENGACAICLKACEHETDEGFLGFCPCKQVFGGTDLEDGSEYIVEPPAEAGGYVWFRFVPETTGAYMLKSLSENSDPFCDIFDEDGEFVVWSDDQANGDLNFSLVYLFEAEKEYYIGLGNYSDTVEQLTFNFSAATTHTAADGSEHAVEYVEAKDPTCIEVGYSNGLYCAECGEFVYGHDEWDMVDYHLDEDWNDICDWCGEDLFVECNHMCHSNNFFTRIIWTIVNLFNSIFGFNPYCDCGVEHY